MRVALVGPELEENLALRYLHAALLRAGHQPCIVDFHAPDQLDGLAHAICDFRPQLVGLSLMFTARAREFIDLAARLRELGYDGHITAGGHFAVFHATQLLQQEPALSSIIFGEGEEAICELAAHLDRPEQVPGIAWRAPDGKVQRSGRRPNLRQLDTRARPSRPEQFHCYLGLPIASLLASRGCFASCDFCSINAWHRESGGPRFRQRSAEAVADEMAELYHRRGVRIFNFQDDQFFLPRERDNLRRLGTLQRALDRQQVGQIALQVKARPDSVTRPVLQLLQQMGLFRMFLGVESNAVVGLETLGRGITREQNGAALALLRELEIHTCFNLLIFDPQSEFPALYENLEFMRRQSYFPLNFCRVEVYAGTAVEQRLRQAGRLRGDFYGYTYTIANPRVQRAYDIFRTVFSPRNFTVEGMNHQTMRVDYYLHLLKHFYPWQVSAALQQQVKGVIAELNQHNADLLGRILRHAERSSDESDEAQQRRTADWCAERVAYDAAMRPRVERLIETITELAEEAQLSPPPVEPARRRPFARAKVVATAALASVLGCAHRSDTHMAEMAPAEPPRCRLERDHPQPVAALRKQVQQRYQEDVVRFAETHDLLRASSHVLFLTIDERGRVERAMLVTTGLERNYHPLRLAEQRWHFPAQPRCIELQVPLKLPRATARVTPTSVPTEMVAPASQQVVKRSPPPPPPPPPQEVAPPPRPHLLTPGEAAALSREIQRRYGRELARAVHRFKLPRYSVPARIKFGPAGRVVRLKLRWRKRGKAQRRFEAWLRKQVRAWRFAGRVAGDRAHLTMQLVPPKPVRPPDTHMAEMAPPDPDWNNRSGPRGPRIK